MYSSKFLILCLCYRFINIFKDEHDANSLTKTKASSASCSLQSIRQQAAAERKQNEQTLVPVVDKNISALTLLRQLFMKNFSEGGKIFGNFTSTRVKLAAWEQNLALKIEEGKTDVESLQKALSVERFSFYLV